MELKFHKITKIYIKEGGGKILKIYKYIKGGSMG